MRALTIFKQKDLPAETKLKEIPPDEQAILDCIARTKKFVTQRALVTAGASAIPIPGINVTVDVTMLISILNFINQEFGLTPQQIQHLSTDKQGSAVSADYRDRKRLGRETDHEVLSPCRS